MRFPNIQTRNVKSIANVNFLVILMRLAFVGCGYVADYYAQTLKNHRELELIGVYDRNTERLKQFSRYYQLATYPSLAALLIHAFKSLSI